MAENEAKASIQSQGINGVPRHIGVILDGNRRFARKLNLDPWRGHEWGERKVQKLVDWCKEFGVEELTIYAFSVQNFDRPKKEFDYIVKLFEKAAENLLKDKRLYEYDIRIKFIGRIDMFPARVQELMHKLMDLTKEHSKYSINFAMAYGGREEIIDAIRALAPRIRSGEIRPSEIDESLLSKYLYLESEPDLIIRTGGEHRTSNFLIWQSSYSEWIFLDKSWPEFEKEDFEACLDEYSRRERRMGK